MGQLDNDDLKIITLEVQHLEKSPRKGGRGIRMDVYARDDAGKYYDIEKKMRTQLCSCNVFKLH